MKIILQKKKKIEMKDLQDAKKILGMETEKDRVNGGLWISHDSYLWRFLSNFHMDQSKAIATLM